MPLNKLLRELRYRRDEKSRAMCHWYEHSSQSLMAASREKTRAKDADALLFANLFADNLRLARLSVRNALIKSILYKCTFIY